MIGTAGIYLLADSKERMFLRIVQSIFDTQLKGLTLEEAYQITEELFCKNYGLTVPFTSFQSYQEACKRLENHDSGFLTCLPTD